MTDHHDDPAADAAARAAQLAAMALSITEGLARLHTERLAGRAADDERHAGAVRAQHRAEAAAAWLAREPGAVSASGPIRVEPMGPPPQVGPVAVTIVCSRRDLADQAFPVGIADAMATAPKAAAEGTRHLDSALGPAARRLPPPSTPLGAAAGAVQRGGGR
jgi:hypothetical protein